MNDCNPAPTCARRSDYRPDIDGLRAVAVLLVVIFHFFPGLIHGGFVGVDIFFLISGFLISKHIWEELNAGAFSIRIFYARRARRIFPALCAVLFACLVMGWVILTPAEYEQLGKHVVAGAVFVSNVVLWKESGYFDNAADTKPLLHLWSLGIEEQFYIVWPLLLAFLWRFYRNPGWALPIIIVVSLGYSIMVAGHDVVADFYSPLTRFWELALGAGLAYLSAHKPAPGMRTCSCISLLGLCMIFGSAIVIEKDFLFPGAWALLPTLGAAFLIYAGETAWPNRNLLSLRLLVWVGLISYPLYLWHWPLLSFARIMESGTPSSALRFCLVIVSFILAWLTYKFLERPVRSRAVSSSMVPMLCLIMFLIGIAGLTVKKMDGFKSRQFAMLNGDPGTLTLGADRERLLQECGIEEAQKSIFQYCLGSGTKEPLFALIGDSKGEALFYGLVRESNPDMQWVMIGSVSPPEGDPASRDLQQLKNRLAFQTMAQNSSVEVVVLAVALRSIFPLDSNTGFISAVPFTGKVEAYSQAIRQLEKAGKRVAFVIDNPTFPDPTSCISGQATSIPVLSSFLRRKENQKCTVRYTDHLAGTHAYRQFIGELKRLNPDLAVYDPTPLLCDIPSNICSTTDKGNFLYSYGDHISDYANSMIARDMLPVIRGMAR